MFTAFIIAILISLGIIQNPEEVNQLNQEQIEYIENNIITEQVEV